MNKIRFEELNCSPEIMRALGDMGFKEATPIQAMAIPIVKEGRDVFGQAQTGTGKTAAFAIPTLDKINTEAKELQALVLCPTRELAVQVCEEFEKLGKYKKKLSVLAVYGGASMDNQIRSLRRGVQIIVGTPGRVMDHMRRGTVKLDKLNTLVLDEADEMLNMGFREDIEEILAEIEQPIQKLLFSATMKPSIMDIIKKHLNKPAKVKIENKELTTSTITQNYIEVREDDKPEVIGRLIDVYNPKLALIFCNTKMRVDELTDELQRRGLPVDKIHGDMKQAVRISVIDKFKQGIIKVLIATDVAARGLDIDDVEMVINYNVPQHEEHYVHRIGRTGRAGREGTSFTMVTSREYRALKEIMMYTKKQMEKHSIPSVDEVKNAKINLFIDDIKKDLEEGIHEKYIDVIETLKGEGYSPLDIAAAIIGREIKLGEAKEILPPEKEKKGRRNAGVFSRDADMARFFVNVGRMDNIKPADLVRIIADNAGIRGKEIGSIDIYDKYSFVEIPEKHTSKVLDSVGKTKVKGIRLNIELAQKKGSGKKKR